jgi:DNA-binding transcriptional MerR regulator
MPYKRLSTAKIAKIVGCHPNTVRKYEEWGFLPPIPRSANNYRLFRQDHLDQMRLARCALNTPYPGKTIRRASVQIVRQAARGDLGGALENTYHYLALIQSERNQAEITTQLVKRWALGFPAEATRSNLSIHKTAQYLNVTTDQLRNWERNGLLTVPRNPKNRYRIFGAKEIARARIIRMLRVAGYSLSSILRLLTQLDMDANTDIIQVLDTPREDEDVLHAADRWISTLKDMENSAREMISILEERLVK